MTKKDFLDRLSYKMEEHISDMRDDLDARGEGADGNVYETVGEFAPLEFLINANQAMAELKSLAKKGRMTLDDEMVCDLSGYIIMSLYEMMIFMEYDEERRR